MQDFNFLETAVRVMSFFVPFLFALCFHEFAHGWVAKLKGDRTAEMMGRLTLNPMAHADPLGTFFLPIMSAVTHIPMFGWAKPVPVDERNLKNPKADIFWISSAGPLSNLFLALIGAIAIGFFYRFNYAAIETEGSGASAILDVMRNFVQINVYLAVFNMIPLHPLDGGKVIARFLPDRINRNLEDMQQYTSFILLALFLTGTIGFIAGPARFIIGVFSQIASGVAGA
jgi:Zn-dependent protease